MIALLDVNYFKRKRAAAAPAGSFLLLENGFTLALESGDIFILET